MKFFIPRDSNTQPVVVDRLGRDLSAHGFDIISISYTASPQGEYVTLHVYGTAIPPGQLPTPFRLVTGEHDYETRLYDHTNTELVNALRAANVTPVSDNGLVAYSFTIPLRADDIVEIASPTLVP